MGVHLPGGQASGVQVALWVWGDPEGGSMDGPGPQASFSCSHPWHPMPCSRAPGGAAALMGGLAATSGSTCVSFFFFSSSPSLPPSPADQALRLQLGECERGVRWWPKGCARAARQGIAAGGPRPGAGAEHSTPSSCRALRAHCTGVQLHSAGTGRKCRKFCANVACC